MKLITFEADTATTNQLWQACSLRADFLHDSATEFPVLCSFVLRCYTHTCPVLMTFWLPHKNISEARKLHARVPSVFPLKSSASHAQLHHDQFTVVHFFPFPCAHCPPSQQFFCSDTFMHNNSRSFHVFWSRNNSIPAWISKWASTFHAMQLSAETFQKKKFSVVVRCRYNFRPETMTTRVLAFFSFFKKPSVW